MDVRRSLKAFLIRTETLKKTDSSFINFSTPNLEYKMSSAAIGSVIRSCIKKAYRVSRLEVLKGITAHSTRSAATSVALSKGASVEEICRAATWSSLSTFVRHYKLDKLDSADALFSCRVLQHAIKVDDNDLPGLDHRFGSSLRCLPIP